MYANYHTHTYHSNHATGTPREYVLRAIENGVHILGFSDHVPYPFENFNSGYRIAVAETEKYVNEILSLREEYKEKITILIGYEAEYYPEKFDEMLAHIRKYECDYLILAQHFTNNEHDGVYVYRRTDSEDVLKRYVSQLICGMETGLFSYIAHPDLIAYENKDKLYEEQMTMLCERAKELNIPIEINLLGLRENRGYPCEKFWKIAAKVQGPVILGCDAHSVRGVCDPEDEVRGMTFAEKFGITPQKTLKLNRVE